MEFTKEAQDNRMRLAAEWLKERNYTITEHFSPYAEGSKIEDQGSRYHIFKTACGVTIRFLFREDDKFEVYI